MLTVPFSNLCLLNIINHLNTCGIVKCPNIVFGEEYKH